MGLSDTERAEKISWSIRAIVEISDNLKSRDYPKLKQFCEKLWPAFLGQSGNSSFWIFGGSWDSNHVGKFGLLETAFKDQSNQLKKDDWGQPEKEEGEYKDSLKCMEAISDWLKIENFYAEKREIIKIWEWIENLVYALRRYNDEFLSGLENLNNLVSNIQGELFDIVQKDCCFYKAWLLKNIVDKAVNIWSEEDIVSKWFHRQNLHHYVTSTDIELEELQKIFFSIQPQKQPDIPEEKRIILLLRLMGRRYEYDHHFKELVKLINGKFSVKNIEREFKKCKKLKVQYDKKPNKYGEIYCHLSGNVL